MEKEYKPQRLCSEIQLFDICSKDRCSHKDGRFCTNAEILARFEGIREDDEARSQQFFEDGVDDAEEGADDFGYDDELEEEYEEGEDDPEDW